MILALQLQGGRTRRRLTILRLIVSLATLLLLTSAGSAQLELRGCPCTVDCSGHEASYEWAEDQGITDPYECGGNSNSFIQGCEAWAEEQPEEAYGYSDYEEEENEEGGW